MKISAGMGGKNWSKSRACTFKNVKLILFDMFNMLTIQ